MIKIDKGENVGNTLKLISGFILFVVGILIAYETSVYNLLDVLLIAGLVISIVGIMMMVSYFIDSNADKTTNIIKDFLESNDINSSSVNRFNKKQNTKKGPLNVRSNIDDFYTKKDYNELSIEDFERDSSQEHYSDDGYVDRSKSVLNVVPQEKTEADFNKKLNFTPNYEKPLKVTRAPKKREEDYFSQELPRFSEETPKTEEIKRFLSEDDGKSIQVQHQPAGLEPKVEEEPQEIKIDVNNPESLPIPDSLNSYVIGQNGLLTSKDAFEQLAVEVNKEIMLEIPSLNNLSDRVLSHVPTIYSRVIIDEFDSDDLSYMFLITSLLKQGVHIRTVPKVHSTNLITDDSFAMIISEDPNQLEYGAIYDDRASISSIRADFEKTWDIASNLDESILINSVSGGVA